MRTSTLFTCDVFMPDINFVTLFLQITHIVVVVVLKGRFYSCGHHILESFCHRFNFIFSLFIFGGACSLKAIVH